MLRLKEAKKRAEEFIRTALLLQSDQELDVFMWENKTRASHIGVRVTEVSVVSRQKNGSIGGYSFMQSDVDGGFVICAAVERLIIAYMDAEEVEEAEGMVQYLMNRPDGNR